jgi:hypothetical protein
MPNYQPGKHHFIPAFAQTPWAGNDDQVCQMRLINGRVVPLRRHPNATGFEPNLYTTAGVPPEFAQHLEVNFFTPLDSDAAEAVQRMLAMDLEPWPARLRLAWTVYLLSMKFRNPEAVSLVKEQSETMWREGLAVLEGDYAARRRPTDPPDFAGYFARIDPAAPQIGATNFLIEIINNDRVGPDIAKMHWSVVRPTLSRVPLLLSDRPLIQGAGLGDPQAFLILPIAPDTFFLASNDPRAVDMTATKDHTWLVTEINKIVVGQAVEFVWGSNDGQIEFVREHFGTCPLPPVITAAQRERAVAAARGEIGR